MAYKLEHTTLTNNPQPDLHNIERLRIFDTYDEAKLEFMILIDLLATHPECEAWDSENMIDNEPNEELCCGICDMCSVVYENDENDPEFVNDHTNNNLFLFKNIFHHVLIQKINQSNSVIP